MSGKPPRCSRHKVKRYTKFKDRVIKHKKARVLREWKRATKDKSNAFAKHPKPDHWKPATERSEKDKWLTEAERAPSQRSLA